MRALIQALRQHLLQEWRLLLVLVVAFLAAMGGVLWYISVLQDRLVQSTSLRYAGLYAEALGEFRTLYTSEVVQTAMRNGLEVTHDYVGKPKAIPLPATLSMLLGKQLGQRLDGANARLYSAYPFPWRSAEGALDDPFRRAAWVALNRAPTLPYFRVDELDGRPTLRYATADRMREGCIACHNHHPQSPKRDWKVGDVRGVLEVDLPLDAAAVQVQRNLKSATALLLALAMVGVLSIWLFVRKLRQGSEVLQQRVDERTRALQAEVTERKRAEEAAEAASHAKSLFLANITHEIRTPLNAVLGFSQLLRRDSSLTHAQRETITIIEKAGDHLLALINDILDLSKIEAGAMALQESDFDLADMLHDLDSFFSLRCAQKNLGWEIESGCGDTLPVRGDPGKLRQVLINLLGNAIKFTSSGVVSLTVQPKEGNLVYFEVSDTGPGIAFDQQQRIFDPFHQADAAQTHGGTGLGLSIARAQVELMGGTLELHSIPGAGASFHFSVPLPPASAAVVHEETDSREVARLAPGYQVDALVVDDVENNRQVLSRLLADIGVSVRVAASGAEALALLRKRPSDIVFLDIRMPGMSGDEALRHIRAEFEVRPVCVAISASSLVHEVEYYRSIGFDEYVTKPFRLAQVYGCLSRFLRVEFEYVEVETAEGATPASFDGSQVRLPEDLYQRLLWAAERQRITELRRLLDDVARAGDGGERLAAHLRALLANVDMAAILATLKELPHG